MDKAKQAAFVRANRQRFSKGGLVKRVGNRKYFDSGGLATTFTPAATTLQGAGSGGVNQNAVNPNTGVLGSISGALGLNNNFQANGANIQQGTNNAQLNQAYTSAQQGLNDQSRIVNTLNPQVAGAVQNQNALANQLYGMTQGQGPNPAQMELAQATANNVAQTGAQMAGARGASGNVGLMARQIGQQGAATQQAGAGQAATLEAQQQIAAQQNLANLANTQVGQAQGAVTGENQAQQNEQNTLQGANTAANNAAVGMQSNVNSTNAQTAAGNQGLLGKVLGGVGSAVSSVTNGLGLSHGGEVEAPSHIKLAEMNAHSMKYAGGGPIVGNPLLGNQSTPAAQSFVGQYVNSAPSAGPNIQAASPMPDQNYSLDGLGSAAGNALNPNGSSGSATNRTEAQTKSDYANADAMLGNNPGQEMAADNSMEPQMAAHGGMMEQPKNHVANFLFGKGGKVPAMVSPGEIYLSPEKVHKVIHEGVDPAKIGEKFKGKAKVKGDSLKNDTIPKDLEEGGVVIDRKNMGTREKRELFVHRAIARKKAGGQ